MRTQSFSRKVTLDSGMSGGRFDAGALKHV